MLRSMTAYGRGEFLHQGVQFVAEVRSVNHRFLDLHLRIPRNFQVLEDALKKTISGRIRRGRVEATVQMGPSEEALAASLELNTPLVEAYLRVLDQLEREFGIEKGVRGLDLVQMKDIIVFESAAVESDAMLPGFMGALEQALDSLDEMRLNEGKALEADFRKRLERIRTWVGEIDKKRPELAETYRTRLKERVGKILNGDVDEARLEQEVVFYADRSDITEELVRIASHLEQFEAYLDSDDVVGRRLDFLIQEINREVNTLSVKASDASISKIVVEVKAELEKMREQAQNVE